MLRSVFSARILHGFFKASLAVRSIDKGIEMNIKNKSGVLTAFSIISFMLAPACSMAATVWVDWTSATQSSNPYINPVTPGSASGSMDSIAVSYSGELSDNTVVDGSFAYWDPASSFTGGVVDGGPGTVGDIIGLNGNVPTQTNTITFSSAVTNPVIAIWSLGRWDLAANFIFDQTPTLLGGGSTTTFGGDSINVNGNTVSGSEGNGVVQFQGTYTSLSWSNDVVEGWYGFTVGHVQPVPVPAAIWLFASGFLGLLGLARTREIV